MRISELVAVDGLAQELVAAGAQAGDARVVVVQRRDENDGQILVATIGLELLGGLEAADARQHDVEQHEVGLDLRRHRQRSFARAAR